MLHFLYHHTPHHWVHTERDTDFIASENVISVLLLQYREAFQILKCFYIIQYLCGLIVIILLVCST